MWPLDTTDLIIFGIAATLTIAAILLPSNRRVHIAAVLSLAAIALGYTILRPGARAALAHYKQQGGINTAEWLAGVTSLLEVTRHFSTVVVVAALLLALLALRSK